MTMTPLQLEILLHYRTRANDYRNGDFSAPAVKNAMSNFVVLEGMLKPTCFGAALEQAYTLTERGHAFVDAMCNLPLPKQIWAMPNTHGSGINSDDPQAK